MQFYISFLIYESVVNYVTPSTMDKNTKKRTSYNTLVIERLHEKYGYSKNYIRECINGTRKAEVAEILKREYTELEKKVRVALGGG